MLAPSALGINPPPARLRAAGDSGVAAAAPWLQRRKLKPKQGLKVFHRISVVSSDETMRGQARVNHGANHGVNPISIFHIDPQYRYPISISR